MDQTCPACKAVNDEDAKYCDQCGQPLVPVEKDEGDGNCPACGGVVDDQGDGKGVCRGCGLELNETPAPAAAPVVMDRFPEKLVAAALRRTDAGMPVDQAILESCREVLGAAEAPEEETAAAVPCPLCGRENPETSPRCGGCGLWFESRHRPGPCPTCGEEASGDRCECGALLTLPALLELMEPSVRFLCSKCKHPYVASAPSCPDCGGSMISAARLQDYARRA